MSPTNWLVEVSGIPFGHMGDMLHEGGNRWMGMQYGMTVRHPWVTNDRVCDPRPIWKIWDDFGIEESKMIGFWEKNPAATTTDADVKVTAYVKKGKTLLSIANYSDEDKQTKIDIDWEALGLNPSKVKMEAPEIADFQTKQSFDPEQYIPLEAKKGWLLILENK